MEPSQINAFLEKYDKGLHTEAEHRLFINWLATASPDETAQVVAAYGDITEAKQDFLPADPALAARIEAGIHRPEGKLVAIHRFRFGRIAAAVAIMAIGLSVFLLMRHRPTAKLAVETSSYYKNDLPPGGNKATLTLANGETVVLDSASEGRLARQGNTNVLKTGSGELTYAAASGQAAGVLYNSLSTPRGGQYRLVLPDGSKVWLNAASSLRFPASFDGAERRVELTGEAYFEIAPRKMPFIVRCRPAVSPAATPAGDEVEVLGTHFNINAYKDEEAVKTTLLEGSVRLKKETGETALLTPGQQGAFGAAKEIKVTGNINTDEVVAWTNNRFYFRSADIKTIMRQLARWYDVDIVYNKEVQGRFNAEIPRNTNASDVLKALELTGKVKFGIDGKKIIVMP